jgi:hypothetical protein
MQLRNNYDPLNGNSMEKNPTSAALNFMEPKYLMPLL